MMELQDQLTQMREILYRPASASAWHELLTLFERWPHHDGLQVALDYANTHLEGWPVSQRAAPRRWVERLLDKKRPHPAWSLVRSVVLSRQGLGPEDAYCLACNRAMSQVEQLLLSYNQLGAEGLAYLAQSENLGKLRTLDVSSNGLVGRLDVLVEGGLPSLSALYLGDNSLRDQSLEVLVKASFWDQLTHLDLQGTRMSRYHITVDGVSVLVSRGAPSLRSLSLYGQALDTSAAQILGGRACSAFPRLEVLNVSYNRLCDEGAYALLGAQPLPRLKHLLLRGCYVSEVDQRALRALFAQQYPGARLEIP